MLNILSQFRALKPPRSPLASLLLPGGNRDCETLCSPLSRQLPPQPLQAFPAAKVQTPLKSQNHGEKRQSRLEPPNQTPPAAAPHTAGKEPLSPLSSPLIRQAPHRSSFRLPSLRRFFPLKGLAKPPPMPTHHGEANFFAWALHFTLFGLAQTMMPNSPKLPLRFFNGSAALLPHRGKLPRCQPLLKHLPAMGLEKGG